MEQIIVLIIYIMLSIFVSVTMYVLSIFTNKDHDVAIIIPCTISGLIWPAIPILLLIVLYGYIVYSVATYIGKKIKNRFAKT